MDLFGGEQKKTDQKAWSYHKQSNGKDEWLTPPEIIKSLGDFDLDPCAPIKRPWEMAKHHYTALDNGLIQDWFGRVWCNPPYGTQTGLWLNKLSKHGDGIAMIFARTETKMFFEFVWDRCDAILFIKGRVTFRHVDGTAPKFTSGGPSCLVAYGLNNVIALKNCGIEGKLIVNGL